MSLISDQYRKWIFFKHNFLLNIYQNAQNCSTFLFMHRENDPKRPSYCSILRDHFIKNNFNAKSDQNIHHDPPNCTFFLNFLAGEHGPLHSFRMLSKYTLKCINYEMFPKNVPRAITNLIANVLNCRVGVKYSTCT